jgi:DNA-directed RNA polymerase specialized sigma24 family protein
LRCPRALEQLQIFRLPFHRREDAIAAAWMVVEDPLLDRAVEGLAYDEVSKRLNLPLGSIGPMYLRAKSKMRLQMAA